MQMRLDVYLTQKFGVKSRNRAQALISDGLIKINGEMVKKASTMVNENDEVKILEHFDYISKGAFKLIGAIEAFNLDFNNRVVLDVGASTGGFTQVALLNGAIKVYSLDVGENELDERLKTDSRVINLESTDIRKLENSKVGDVNFIVGDLSFISLTKIFESLKMLFGTNMEMMFLFKPQFECGKDIAKKYRGIIRDKKVHIEVLKQFVSYCVNLGFSISNITHSPIKGGDGNIEYLIHFNKDVQQEFNIEKIVNNAFVVL